MLIQHQPSLLIGARSPGFGTGRCLRYCCALACSLMLLQAPAAESQDEQPQRDGPAGANGAASEAPPVFLIPVSLPLTGTDDTRLRQMIDQVLQRAPQSRQRPVLILEFRAEQGESGEASQFERALSVARYLASERLSGVRTIAYMPQSVKGHAVLAAVACEELVMAPDAEFGQAGIGEAFIDATMRQGYSEIAARRRTVPVPVVLGMLERELAVYRVQTLDGVRYALEDELEELQKTGTVSSVETLVREGDLALFTGRELRLKYGFVSHLAADHAQLAAALQVPAQSIEQDPSLGGRWHAVRIDVQGPISSKNINWVIKSLSQRLRHEPVNFVCVYLNSPGGSPADSLRLAHSLAELGPSRVRTVAFVEEARGDASLIAIGCDNLVVTHEAVLGGPGAKDLNKVQLEDLRVAVKDLAKKKQRSWSLAAALVDPKLSVYRYQNQRTKRSAYYAPQEVEELENSQLWQRREAVPIEDGLSGREAVNLQLARFSVGSFQEFRQLYHLEEALEPIEPNWAHLLIEKLASPKIAGGLLFIAWFALMIELMSPGIGVAGFLSGLCFLLFFWANFLHGTAGWLEILLFIAGAACLVLELFVLPGFGVFGLGGGLMIIASLVLASQTFVIPRNPYQFEQLPSSLFTVIAGGAGMFAALAIMRRYLPNAPIFNRLMLSPPDEEALEELGRRESLANYDYLLHKRGVTTTRLAPSGKARFGDDVVSVVSDGELIPAGSDVYVAEVRGNHVLVRTLES